MNTGIRYDLAVRHNGTFSEYFNVLNPDGSYFNLSGYSGQALIYNKFGDPTGLSSFTVTVTGAVSGYVNLYMNSSGIAALPVTRAIYSLDLIQSGVVTKDRWGYFDIYP